MFCIRARGYVSTRCNSTSGSLPTVAEKRTFGVLSVRTPDEEVRAACALSKIAQLYTALLHCMFAGSDLSIQHRRAAIPDPIRDLGYGLRRTPLLLDFSHSRTKKVGYVRHRNLPKEVISKCVPYQLR
jgi:hypothetical protein